MAELDFPLDPIDGQTYTSGGRTWTYSAEAGAWVSTGGGGYSGGGGSPGEVTSVAGRVGDVVLAISDISGAVIGTDLQAWDADLTAIAALGGTSGYLKKVGADTWALDAGSSVNELITLTGDASGSGTSSIPVTISSTVVTGKLLTGYSVGSSTALTATDSILQAFGKLQGQLNNAGGALDPDLVAIGALEGSSGLLRKTAPDTWALDSATYLTTNQLITLTGDASGSGTTSISVSISDPAVTGKLLTGYTTGANSPVVATDTVLEAFGKLQGQLASGEGGGGGSSTGVYALVYVIDGGDQPITTGVKGDLVIPFACTVTEWVLVSDQTGSIVVDVWNDSLSAYPPTVADSITGSSKPTLSGAVKNNNSGLSGWTPTIGSGSTLRFNVDSASTVTRVTLTLFVTVAAAAQGGPKSWARVRPGGAHTLTSTSFTRIAAATVTLAAAVGDLVEIKVGWRAQNVSGSALSGDVRSIHPDTFASIESWGDGGAITGVGLQSLWCSGSAAYYVSAAGGEAKLIGPGETFDGMVTISVFGSRSGSNKQADYINLVAINHGPP